MAGIGGLLVAGAAIVWWRGSGAGVEALPPMPAARADAAALPGEAPAASEKTREQKRFDRYDKDRDEAVTKGEYLASRHKAYARLDADGDGRLSFEEWSGKTLAKFTSADADRSGALNRDEFATTKVKRKAPARCACPEGASD
jgi:hypothetical protein